MEKVKKVERVERVEGVEKVKRVEKWNLTTKHTKTHEIAAVFP